MVGLEDAPLITETGGEERRRQEVEVLEKHYPERWGQVRRIHYLFGSYYRVNYHLLEKQNAIGKSHFVQVKGDKVVERN
jgi:hypothetical protein